MRHAGHSRPSGRAPNRADDTIFGDTQRSSPCLSSSKPLQLGTTYCKCSEMRTFMDGNELAADTVRPVASWAGHVSILTLLIEDQGFDVGEHQVRVEEIQAVDVADLA